MTGKFFGANMNKNFTELADMEDRARTILGVEICAGRLEIKRAYWILAMKYHPDKDPSDKSLDHKFAVISQAYEILTSNKNISTRRLDESEVRLFRRDLTGPVDYLSWWKDRFFI